MKVWRADHSLAASRNASWQSVVDSFIRLAPPVAVVIVCIFVTFDIVRSQNIVLEVAQAKIVESKLSATLIGVHTVKSRVQEYLLTGSERYLARNARDLEATDAVFAELERLMAQDPGQQQRLVRYRAATRRLLTAMGQAIDQYRASDKTALRHTLSSGAFAELMEDNSIGSSAILRVQRERIAAVQKLRIASFTRTLVDAVALLLVIILSFVLRIAMMNAHVRRQKLSMRRVERARQAAEKARAAAEKASQAKLEFLASVSHELRTPLNAVLGFSELISYQMLGPAGNPRYVEYAADIHNSGLHLLELVNDILDISKISAGKMELRESEFCLADLMSNCLALLGDKAHAHLVLKSEIDPNLPPVHADFKLIKQILLNLLSNAAKFTPPGGHIAVTADYRAGQGIAICVEDSGIGMSPRDIEKALSPFGQIDSKIARRHQGAGLGLPISRSYAELHDGRLVIDSTEGQGTRVTLHLPQIRVRASIRLAS